MKGIADILLKGIVKRSREQLGIVLAVGEDARDYLMTRATTRNTGPGPCAGPSRAFWRISWRRGCWRAASRREARWMWALTGEPDLQRKGQGAGKEKAESGEEKGGSSGQV